MNKKFITILMIFLLMVMPTKLVQGSSMQIITLGTAVTGEITKDEKEDLYKLVLPSAGKLTLNGSSEAFLAELILSDEQGNKAIDLSISGGSVGNPEAANKSIDLEPGTYYIKMCRLLDYTGKYTLKADFKAANNNDVEPNNRVDDAQKIDLNESALMGYITWNDKVDIYKVKLEGAGKISLNILSNFDSNKVTVFDSYGNTFVNDYLYYGTESNPKNYYKNLDLEEGIYYIKVDPDYGYTGKYSIKVNYKAANNNESEPNNRLELAQGISTNGTSIVGYLTLNDEVDIYKVALQKSEKLNLNVIAEAHDIKINILDSQGKEIASDYVADGSEGNPKILNKALDLKPGTYYIKLSRVFDRTGKYTIKITTKQGWVNEGGKWYYYDLVTGAKRTGWLNLSGKWYFLDSNGVMKTGWINLGGTWYYLESSGVMKTGWLLLGDTWYYLEGGGAMRTGWLNLGGNWYFLESSGAMKTGWLLEAGKWYYLYDSGVMARNTVIDGYRLGSDGAWIQ